MREMFALESLAPSLAPGQRSDSLTYDRQPPHSGRYPASVLLLSLPANLAPKGGGCLASRVSPLPGSGCAETAWRATRKPMKPRMTDFIERNLSLPKSSGFVYVSRRIHQLVMTQNKNQLSKSRHTLTYPPLGLHGCFDKSLDWPQ